MITEPSAISPKSSAPRLMRLPLTSSSTMPVTAISIASGITEAAISAARRLPSSTSSTITTSAAPSRRFLLTVSSVAFTR